MTHNSVARKVRLDKEKNPLKYCTRLRCLYVRPCPKHSEEGQRQALEAERYDHTRLCHCGAPWDKDQQMFACQD